MVGCGAAAAISGAFGAPLAGAFYAFELVLGGYTPASLTPVGVAAVAGYFVTHGFTGLSLGVSVRPVGDVLGRDLAIAALVGILAALLMGALGGRLFAAGVDLIWPGLALDPNVYAIIGMSALSASVIGGPLTMSFIALESTGNLWLTTIVLVAVIISTQITRELFGYSFATWRLHLPRETIRSAAHVGWIRDLTVRRLMRPDVATVDAGIGIKEFREKFPLGSKTQVVAVDPGGRYVGLALVAEAHAPDIEAAGGLGGILHHRDVGLHPVMNIQEAMAVFDAAEAESLAGVETDAEHRPIRILTDT